MDRFWQDLNSAWRAMRRAPASSLVAILTLGLGIGGSTLIFSLVYGVLLTPLPYPHGERLVMLWQRHPERGGERERVTPANFADWRAQNTVFDEIAYMPAWRGSRWWSLAGDRSPGGSGVGVNGVGVNGVGSGGVGVSGVGHGSVRETSGTGHRGHERVARAWVSSRFFSALGVMPSLGRAFSAAEDAPGQPPSVIISHALWQRRFGGAPDIIGRTLTFDSIWRTQHTVVGVMPPGFAFPGEAESPNGDKSDDGASAGGDAPTETWVPIGLSEIRAPAPDTALRCCPWLEVIARLAPGVTLAQAQAQMDVIADRIARSYPQARDGSEIAVVPLREQAVGAVRPTLVVLLGAVACVLVIACANVANLLLVRATARQREMSVRAALGASRRDLVRQLLFESVLLSGTGGLLGVALAWTGLAAIAATFGAHVPRLDEVRLNAIVLAFAALLSLVTGVLFGLAPASVASKAAPQEALKTSGGLGLSPGSARLRHALVVIEIAIALVLMTGAGLLTRSLLGLQRIDPGYQASHRLTAHVDMTAVAFDDGGAQRYFGALMPRLAGLPGVEAVAGASTLPLVLGGRPLDLIRADGTGGGPQVRLSASWFAITPDYFRVLGAPMRRGRPFTERDAGTAPKVAIINETLARRYWRDQDPIGRVVYSVRRDVMFPQTLDPRDRIQIVGVVADMRTKTLRDAPRPEVYFPYTQFPWHEAQLIVRARPAPAAGDLRALAAALPREARALNSAAVLTRVRPMDAIVLDSIARPRLGTLVLGLFASVGLLLTALGISAVIAYTVAQRTREIGIRMALGAARRHVLHLIVRQSLRLTLTGIVIGLAGAAGLTRVLRTLLYAVSPLDPVSLGGATLLLTLVALTAAALPAWRATRVDPLVALRTE